MRSLLTGAGPRDGLRDLLRHVLPMGGNGASKPRLLQQLRRVDARVGIPIPEAHQQRHGWLGVVQPRPAQERRVADLHIEGAPVLEVRPLFDEVQGPANDLLHRRMQVPLPSLRKVPFREPESGIALVAGPLVGQNVQKTLLSVQVAARRVLVDVRVEVGRHAGAHLGQEHAQRKVVHGAGPHGVSIRHHRLFQVVVHVRVKTKDLPWLENGGESEVNDLQDAAVLPGLGQHDVVGLQVLVDHAALCEPLRAGRHLHEELLRHRLVRDQLVADIGPRAAARRVRGHTFVQQGREGASGGVLHDHHALAGTQLEDFEILDDVRVREAAAILHVRKHPQLCVE
mmetsp:Transcript_38428/g.86618  ORF Transcript_38428/g.86618 Transcript_38428/m.86618 type:complete len:341 (+) Transcript_38428:380-1402(+)